MGGTQWQDALREKGYRLTPQRQLVLEAVTTLGHATVEDVLGEVRRTASGVNITTVYRTLELLEEIGLVTHVHLQHGSPTYHATDVGSEHVHLVCRGCNRVIEAPVDIAQPVVREASRRHGFTVDVTHLAVFGLCRECVEETSERLTEGLEEGSEDG